MGEKSEKYKQMEKYIAKSRMLGLREFEFEYDANSDEVYIVNMWSDGTRTLKVPDFVSIITFEAWYDNDKLRDCKIYIPRNCYIEYEDEDSIDKYESFSSHFKEINVEKEHEEYISQDGVLFNKNKTVLIAYPFYKEDEEYKIPESVVYIENLAFNFSEKLKKVNIPSSVACMKKQKFKEQTEIIVAEGNTSYKSVRGCLYSKDGRVLHHIYGEQNGKIFIEDGTVIIEAIYMDGFYEEISFPKSLVVMESPEMMDGAYFGNTIFNRE